MRDKKSSKLVYVLNFIRLYTHLALCFDVRLLVSLFNKRLNRSLHVWFFSKFPTRRFLLGSWVKQIVSNKVMVEPLTLPSALIVTPYLNLTTHLQQYSTATSNKNLTEGSILLKLFLPSNNLIFLSYYLSYYSRYLFYMNSYALCALYNLINGTKIETGGRPNVTSAKTLFILNLQTL